MALKPSAIKEISQRNKDLTFGYLKNNERQNKTNYTQLIKYLILFYSNAKDCFDPDATHQDLEINGNYLSKKRHTAHRGNSYLKNIVSEGIHIWKFKYHCSPQDARGVAGIGIWKVKSGKPALRKDIDRTNCDFESTGYFITVDGDESNPGHNGQWRVERHNAMNGGDTIEMKLDLSKSILTYEMNGEFLTRFIDIEKTSYRAVIGLYKNPFKEGFTLISYQDFYESKC